MGTPTPVVAAEPVSGPDSVALLRAYLADVVGRYHGRPVTPAEVDEVLARFPNDDLAPPTGLFLVLRHGPTATGCVGLRVLSPELVELKRLYVQPSARGTGAGRALVAAVEQAARDLGARAIRLDTRHDLVEARRLYAACGYVEIPRYNSEPYVDHWFEKRLD